ncbi:GTP cyclohydrolase II [Rothia halotolerans]|uniref:GTP cyclohydrolase II n=1 Tax=Rothia halotolerans TaxID=405770 RepID=UPI00101D47CA|nr:GTP cyclohydrolase II [Rothia halotolerans]
MNDPRRADPEELSPDPGRLVPRTDPELIAVTDPVTVPTPYGSFAVRAWGFADGSEHLSATALGPDGTPVLGSDQAPYVRLHSECLTGDVFGSRRCDCGPQLQEGLRIIASHGGTLVYLRQHEGRGIGLVNKLRAYALQDAGLDTLDANLELGLPADARDYRQAARILEGLGITVLHLVTNNPAKAEALEREGLTVQTLEPDVVEPVPENARYLQTKRDRMNHRLLLHPPGA